MRVVMATTSPQPLASYNAKRRTLSIFNIGTTDYVLFSQNIGKISSEGYPVLVNTSATLVRIEGDEPELDYWIVSNSGTQEVRVFEGFGDPNDATGSEP